MAARLARLFGVSTSRLIPFVGLGVSVQASSLAPFASWTGLLRDGVSVCEREVPDLPRGWGDLVRTRLASADLITLLAIAEEVSSRLRQMR